MLSWPRSACPWAMVARLRYRAVRLVSTSSRLAIGQDSHRFPHSRSRSIIPVDAGSRPPPGRSTLQLPRLYANFPLSPVGMLGLRLTGGLFRAGRCDARGAAFGMYEVRGGERFVCQTSGTSRGPKGLLGLRHRVRLICLCVGSVFGRSVDAFLHSPLVPSLCGGRSHCRSFWNASLVLAELEALAQRLGCSADHDATTPRRHDATPPLSPAISQPLQSLGRHPKRAQRSRAPESAKDA
ncbi:hypothetical protein OH77DRAFT_728660 [Trametes cingulata]|nr:hypothetical protein OH77DRAFT_728660 [Trametes cingulata]